MVTGHISVGSRGISLALSPTPYCASFVKTKIQFIVPMNYDRSSSTILRVVVVFQRQLKVLCRPATHPILEDDEHAPGTDDSDDVLTGGDC